MVGFDPEGLEPVIGDVRKVDVATIPLQQAEGADTPAGHAPEDADVHDPIIDARTRSKRQSGASCPIVLDQQQRVIIIQDMPIKDQSSRSATASGW